MMGAEESTRIEKKLSLEREPVSAFIICYNEQDNIGDCLRSIAFCDEIVVIDSFSNDNTVSIAEALGAKVVQRKWPGFKNQKTFGLSCATYDWVLNLDADERVSDELRESILEVLRAEKEDPNKEDGAVGYYINRVVYYLNRWWRNGGWYPEHRLRFFKKSATTWGGIDPHEKAIVEGPTSTLRGELYHYTYKSMDDHFQRLQNYSMIAAREEYERGRKFKLRQLIFNPVFRFFKFFVLKKGYREGIAGFIVAVAESYYTFMKYAKLWEIYFLKANELKQGGSFDEKK